MHFAAALFGDGLQTRPNVRGDNNENRTGACQKCRFALGDFAAADNQKPLAPLAKTRPDNPALAERFELFAAGRELVNGFSEQNDPQVQAQIFREQNRLRECGDNEAMHYDSDYIRALQHGLPPNAGGGVGIDRLVMLLSDSPSIRDVILFPQLRAAFDNDGGGQFAMAPNC